MKKMIMLSAVLCIGGAWAAIPTTAEGWYTPAKYENTTSYATWEQGGHTYECEVDAEGNILWGEDYPSNWGIGKALEVALKADLKSSRMEEEIKTAPNKVEQYPRARLTIETKDGRRVLMHLAPDDDREEVPAAVDNRRFCPAARDMLSGEEKYMSACAANAFAAYLDFLTARRGGCASPVDERALYDLALTHKEPTLPPEGARQYDCVDAVADMDAMPDGCEAAFIFLEEEQRTERNVRRLVKRLVSDFGGFVAGLDITEEWYMLSHRLRLARERFGIPYDTICGTEIKITSEDVDIRGGRHAVLICGYDGTGVIFENAWGEEWGDRGFAKITWREFAREFEDATVIADGEGIRRFMRREGECVVSGPPRGTDTGVIHMKIYLKD